MGKILIVDDVPTDVALMKMAIAGLGHTVLVANNGIQAIDLVKQEKPNLVLLDIVLPKMDGFQVCRKIKRDPETAHIPIILVSSKTQESDKFWGFKQGANDFLSKPFANKVLVELVNKHILP